MPSARESELAHMLYGAVVALVSADILASGGDDEPELPAFVLAMCREVRTEQSAHCAIYAAARAGRLNRVRAAIESIREFNKKQEK